MLFPLKVIRCLSAMEYVNIPAEETAFKNETLCLTLLWKLKTEMKLFIYGRGEVSLSINLPSHRFLQHSPEVSITFMVVVVCSIRHLRLQLDSTLHYLVRNVFAGDAFPHKLQANRKWQIIVQRGNNFAVDLSHKGPFQSCGIRRRGWFNILQVNWK